MIKWNIWLDLDNLYADREDLFNFSATAHSPWPPLQLCSLFTSQFSLGCLTVACIHANTVQRIHIDV